MSLSVFDIFSVGIGPSSSHTVGPMRAAAAFAAEIRADVDLRTVTRLQVDLYGSLAATGAGHGTPGAVLLGLEGHAPETVDPSAAHARVAEIEATGRLQLAQGAELAFSGGDIGVHPRTAMGRHPNALRFAVHTDPRAEEWTQPELHDAPPVKEALYYSVGGGFIERDGSPTAAGSPAIPDDDGARPGVPLPFSTAQELLEICRRTGLSVSDVMLRNECARCGADEVRSRLLGIWSVMTASIDSGFASTQSHLPGGLHVLRRAPALYASLQARGLEKDHAYSMDWLNVTAMAVNEENAAGGRIVTAPTNGAAGVVPAVLFWALRFLPAMERPRDRDAAVVRYLLTAAAIAVLFKTRASISGAEMGCQGEVGSACSMAAGALAELMGGTPAQVENAAEIGIEHNLGLTCDPIGGLVQIPCIERNAVAAVKAVSAAKIALHGDGTHRVTLDQAIETMRQTGLDMSSKYKETALGGLAVNVPEC